MLDLLKYLKGLEQWPPPELSNIHNVFHVSMLRKYIPDDGNQGGPSLKDHLQVPDGPITRSRAKKIKEAMQGLVQST